MDLTNLNFADVLPDLLAQTTAWGLKVIGALVVLTVGRMIATWIRRTVRRLLERAGTDATLVPFLSGLVYYGVLVAVLVAVLDMVGVQTASLIAVLGAAGLAVGLALQGTLSNFSAGVMLLLFRPFRVGDYVEAGGNGGSVKVIGLFSTILNTPDNVQIIIPNSAVFGNTIKNYAANDTRRVDMVMGISYDDDIGTAIDTIRRVLDQDDRILADPAPVIAVDALGDSSVNLVVRPWCQRTEYWPVKFDLTRTLKEQLEASGCSIPFPQRDVHLFSEQPAGTTAA